MGRTRTSGNRAVVAAIGLVVAGWLWAGPAHADVLTVTWDVVPRVDGELDVTPAYSCTGARRLDRSCRYLWEQGIELFAVNYSFYDDKWFDGFTIGVPESVIGPGEGVQGIRPRCEPGLAPCYAEFTPERLELSGHAAPCCGSGNPNFFILSSRGGLIKLPSVRGLESVDFNGGAWEHLAWMEVGFYMPLGCDEEPPPEELECVAGERALVIERLTFRPIPEPAMVALLGAALTGFAVRRRRFA